MNLDHAIGYTKVALLPALEQKGPIGGVWAFGFGSAKVDAMEGASAGDRLHVGSLGQLRRKAGDNVVSCSSPWVTVGQFNQ